MIFFLVPALLVFIAAGQHWQIEMGEAEDVREVSPDAGAPHWEIDVGPAQDVQEGP